MNRHPASNSFRPLVVLLLALLLPGWQQPGSESEAPSGEGGLREQVEAAIAELTSESSDPSQARADALELYRQALAALGRAEESRAQALQYELTASEAPARLAAIRAELAQTPEPPRIDVPEGATLSTLQLRRAEAEANLAVQREELAALEAEMSSRSERRTTIPQEMARVRGSIEQVSVVAEDPAVADGVLAGAKQALRQAQLEEHEATLRLLQSEQTSYEVRSELLPARRDLAARKVNRAQTVLQAWDALIAERRRSEAERSRNRSQELRVDAIRAMPDTPERAGLVEDLERLSELRSDPRGPAERLEDAKARVLELRSDLSALRARYQRTRSKVRLAGLTDAMGKILRTQYENLPSLRDLDQLALRTQDELAESHLAQIQLEEARETYSDLDAEFGMLESAGAIATAPARVEESTRVARELLTARLELTDGLLRDFEALIEYEEELSRLATEYAALVREVEQYIEERILWVRSVEAESLAELLPRPDQLQEALGWLVDADAWRASREGVRTSWLAWIGSVAVLVALVVSFLVRRPLRTRLGEVAGLVARHRTDDFRLTLRALAWSAALAAPVPLCLTGVGLLLDWHTNGEGAAGALQHAAIETALSLVLPCFLLAALLPKGLGEAHFRWVSGSVAHLRRVLRVFILPYAAGLLVYRTFLVQENELWSHTIGRMAFVFAMGLLAFSVVRALGHRSEVLSEYFRRNDRALITRTRWLWYPLAVLAPVTLAVLALAGYFYTAAQLYERFRGTIAFALVLVFVNALLLRWLYSNRRRLAVEQAVARAQARAKAAEEGEEPGAPAAVDEETVDIPTLDAQTRQLFRSAMTVAVAVGVYLIWANSLPALKGLDRVEVYPQFRVLSSEALERDVEEPVTAAAAPAASSGGGGAPMATPTSLMTSSNSSEPEARQDSDPSLVVTLADLVLAILILVLTTVGALNFPALLEIGLLQRLPLDAGSRYAITTISRYAIVIVGISSSMGVLGIGWAKIQWLAAALTFGLAFGLQEIFANFVSGLIILAERPIRIGDVVTVGATEGRVTRIRMRATTITDWDRRELIVPNREFITGQLINWTLSDPITRFVVPVGIAYGSDTRLARKLLLECAEACPHTLKDPEPSAIFLAFGASSLDFHLRVFLPHRDAYPDAIHDLHSRIDDAFREAGIEISFPQRDLHIRSAEGLEGTVLPSARDRSDAES